MPTPSTAVRADRPTLTIGVLTKNEAHRIENCLRSAAFADQVVVVDSGSTDDTVAIARRLGAEVHLYPDWQGFAVQRTRLLAHATGDYLFYLDADEVVTPALQAEIEAAVRSNERAVWQIEWSVVAYGRELKHFLSQSRLDRMFRRDMIERFDGVVHEHAVLRDGGQPLPRHAFKAKLLHYSRETVRGSLEKLTQYSMLGAAKRAAAGKRGGVLRGMASAFAIFLRLYVFRLGFMGGGPGFLFCFFIALECFFRYAALYYDRDSLSQSVGR
ncbi:MAG: glycosyltransferase family 2 protein [Curvibacter lanceolatus]|jgi:glycosyltransferase involved in cell wall biosynthesis|uniref:glycosyltransferase family 2 protein n=1 Tax=Curvibacter lanceolatus TaxID=86182 RepID=UPI0003A079CA|nr:glycosyltransferase family 2 protein [Curvibacter lanceolatus]MBV5294092.1 glycosyltransferase family 2 protein [Curvibacter lanceolatus]